MAQLVEDVANESLDAAGINFTIGDIQEGTQPAQILLRHYSQVVRQMLRGANWQFARKQAPLTMLADATGQTPDVGFLVIQPWTYEYAYPNDCMKIRFIPWNNFAQGNGAPPGNIAIGTQPLTTASGQPPIYAMPQRPARFLVATDSNYLPPAGAQTWDVQGVSPTSRTVVCANVKNANAVYTALMIYPSVWDPLFRQAVVATLASLVALPLATDKKMGIEMRNLNIAIAKQRLEQARISDGNETWSNNDHTPDWMQARNAGSRRGGLNGPWDGGDGPGMLYGGWESCSFSDGSAY